jgi:hypothetical protein
MFADLQRDAGWINAFSHNRIPAAVDHRTVIRLNRDTLNSLACCGPDRWSDADPSAARNALPVGDGGEQRSLHPRDLPHAATYELTVAEHGTST